MDKRTDVSGHADLPGLASAGVNFKHDSAVSSVFALIDDISGTIQQHSRNAYGTFNADPCNGADFLRQQMKTIHAAEMTLRVIKLELQLIHERTVNLDLDDPGPHVGDRLQTIRQNLDRLLMSFAPDG